MTFDASATTFAKSTIELVVVMSTIGMIFVHIKISCCKRLFAGHADKAFLVISASKPSIFA